MKDTLLFSDFSTKSFIKYRYFQAFLSSLLYKLCNSIALDYTNTVSVKQ